MKPRSVAQFIRDTAASYSAQANYRMRAAYLREHAHAQAANGQPLSARKTRYYADLAEHAARNEYFDEDPL